MAETTHNCPFTHSAAGSSSRRGGNLALEAEINGVWGGPRASTPAYRQLRLEQRSRLLLQGLKVFLHQM